MIFFRLDFESGLYDFAQLKSDDFDFDIQSGKTSSTGTGPKTDHTLREEHGSVFLLVEINLKNLCASLIPSLIGFSFVNNFLAKLSLFIFYCASTHIYHYELFLHPLCF